MNQSTVMVYQYRYMWKCKDDSLRCKYVCGTNEEHSAFQKILQDDEDIVSAMREYQCEVDYAFIGFTEPVKVEKKEANQSEEN